jgi:hypothetical protein
MKDPRNTALIYHNRLAMSRITARAPFSLVPTAGYLLAASFCIFASSENPTPMRARPGYVPRSLQEQFVSGERFG